MIAAAAVALQIEEYQYDNGELVPMHPNAYLEPPCCTSPDSDGLWSCGCGGRAMIICPALDCPGITESDAEMLTERLG